VAGGRWRAAALGNAVDGGGATDDAADGVHAYKLEYNVNEEVFLAQMYLVGEAPPPRATPLTAAARRTMG